MPLWLVLALAAVVLAVLGFVVLADALLWVGVALLVSSLVLTLVALRRRHRTPAALGEATPGTWDHRAARFGWVSLTLAVLAALLLAASIWALASGRSRFSGARPIALLPIDVELTAPSPAVVLGVGLAIAAFLASMGARQAAVAMRVLSRGRGVTDPLPPDAAVAARRVLGPVAVRALQLDERPPWPVTAIPSDADASGARLRCTVLIPAHNEEAVLGRTLASLGGQTRPADRVVVVADNCTDDTVRIAHEHGVEVIETVGNTEHKAGALNQVLAKLLPDADVKDVVLVMDADSTITDDFLQTALELLEADPDLMAVGGLFSGEDGSGLLGQMQRNEFARYQRIIGRRDGRVFVLTGTGSVFRAYALDAVAKARGTLIPGVPGDVYDTRAMTEDNELTLALKSLGAALRSPAHCRVTTEVMPTWRDLRRQRLRWQRGAVENVAAYGFTRTTAVYWGQQIALGYGVVALHAYLLLMVIGLLASDSIRWSPFWLTVGAIFLVERVVTVWAAGWRGRVLAAPLVLELAYAVKLQWTFLASLVQIATRERAGWNYVPRTNVSTVAVPVVLAATLLPAWSPLPSSLLYTTWFEALALFVGVNTLFFAALSLFQVLPPIRKSLRRLTRTPSAVEIRSSGGR